MRKVENTGKKRSSKRNNVAPSGRKEFDLISPTPLRAGAKGEARNSEGISPLPEGSLSFQTRIASLNHLACASVDGQASFVSVLFSAQTSLSLVFAERTDPQGRRAVINVEALRPRTEFVLRSTNASFQSSVGAFGSVPPKGPNRTELLFRKVSQGECKVF